MTFLKTSFVPAFRGLVTAIIQLIEFRKHLDRQYILHSAITSCVFQLPLLITPGSPFSFDYRSFIHDNFSKSVWRRFKPRAAPMESPDYSVLC